jgi:hypothetical protein
MPASGAPAFAHFVLAEVGGCRAWTTLAALAAALLAHDRPRSLAPVLAAALPASPIPDERSRVYGHALRANPGGLAARLVSTAAAERRPTIACLQVVRRSAHRADILEAERHQPRFPAVIGRRNARQTYTQRSSPAGQGR